MPKRWSCFVAFFISLSFFMFIIPCWGMAQEQDLSSAQAVLLVDHVTGQVLLDKDADAQLIPASLVKIMTLKLTYEAIEEELIALDEKTRISENAWQTPGSTMFLLVDTEVTVDELLHGIAIVSGNDACVAMAEMLGGSEAQFVNMMNQRAQEMGLVNTHFVDSHGLSDQNRTSARDIAYLTGQYIDDHPYALELHSTPSYTYAPPGDNPIWQANRNLLLDRFEGTDGLKTGYLSASGYNMVATARRDGMRLIAVLLGIEAPIGTQGEEQRARETIAVLNYGYRNFATVSLASAGEPLHSARVWKGTSDQVIIGPREDVIVTAPSAYAQQLTKAAVFDPDLVAPVEKDMPVGELIIQAGEEELRRFPLVALADVPRAGWFRVFTDTIRMWLARLFGRI